MISWEDLRKILDQTLSQLIAAEREKLKKAGPYPAVADDIWTFNNIPNYRQAIQTIATARTERMMGMPADIPEFAEQLAGDILKAFGIELDRSADLYMQFCEATVRMYLEYTQQRIVLNDNARSFQPGQPAPTTSPPLPLVTLTAPSSGDHTHVPPISEVAEIFCKEMVAGGNWTPKTETECRAAHKMLISIINDSPIDLVDYSAAQYFKTTLMKLPSNMNKKPLYRDKPIKDVLAMQIPKGDLLSISKVNAYISRASALFNWAVRNGHVGKNPFANQKIKEKSAGHEKRDPFTVEDLKALFTSPEYQAGKYKHPYYYWLPLLGLFTGARIDELCQLHLDDIRQIDGQWVFDINCKGEKKLKNQASARIIPIHSRLIALGFLGYVTSLQKKGQARLFPELKKRRDGYSQDASKWFARYRMRCGVTGERKTFHSFRHTVIDHLKQKDIVKEKIAAIAGHKDQSVTMGVYGKPYGPASLVPVIEALDFQVEVPKF